MGTLVCDVERKRNMDQLQQEIQELFSDLWQVPRFSGLRAGFRPHVDCFRTDDALTVLVELPGVDPDKVDLFVAEGTLYLAGRPARPSGAGQVYQQMEIDYGPFRRQVSLGPDVDPARARATYEQGVLTIVCPSPSAPPQAARRHRGDARVNDDVFEPVTEKPEFRPSLPVLPLKETVVFPESMTPLAIGQERSIRLIDDVVAGERLLALVTVKRRAGGARLRRPLRRRHGRDRPQDDPRARRDAAHPRPGRSSASTSTSASTRSRTSRRVLGAARRADRDAARSRR